MMIGDDEQRLTKSSAAVILRKQEQQKPNTSESADEPDPASALANVSTNNTTTNNIPIQPLTRMQTKFIIVILAVCNFFIANGVSLQGPFFPKEAEQKGATPLIYSSIFAIYELVMLVTSFWFGNLVERFKPNLMSGFGLSATGISTATFGLLTYFQRELYFTITAFFLRIIESLGATAFATSSYSFISACFPDRTATMFATMEMFFGLGVITGPVIGGFLYDYGGFLFPFLFIGITITCFGILLISPPIEELFLRGKFLGQMLQNQATTNGHRNLPIDNADEEEVNTLIVHSNDSSNHTLQETINSTTNQTNRPTTAEEDNNVTLSRFLCSSMIMIDSFIIITAITLMGFNGATLEPFIRHQGISNETLHTSLMFVALGASYSFSALIWGRICDRFPSLLMCFSIFGSIITGIGLLFLGPVPFMADLFRPSLWTISVCMLLFGIGTSSKQVAAYTHANNYTIQIRKFPANQKTYGYISGMFFSCLSFGGFIGPIIGGSLLQFADFQHATLVMFALECLVLVILFILQCYSFCSKPKHIVVDDLNQSPNHVQSIS